MPNSGHSEATWSLFHSAWTGQSLLSAPSFSVCPSLPSVLLFTQALAVPLSPPPWTFLLTLHTWHGLSGAASPSQKSSVSFVSLNLQFYHAFAPTEIIQVCQNNRNGDFCLSPRRLFCAELRVKATVRTQADWCVPLLLYAGFPRLPCEWLACVLVLSTLSLSPHIFLLYWIFLFTF